MATKPKVSPQAKGRMAVAMRAQDKSRNRMRAELEKKADQLRMSDMSAKGQEFRRGDRVPTPAEQRRQKAEYNIASTRGRTRLQANERARAKAKKGK